MISRCVASRQFRGKVCLQKMGDLPSDGLTQEPRFTFCGIDMFKPFMVKDGRKQNVVVQYLDICLAEWCKSKLQTA